MSSNLLPEEKSDLYLLTDGKKWFCTGWERHNELNNSCDGLTYGRF